MIGGGIDTTDIISGPRRRFIAGMDLITAYPLVARWLRRHRIATARSFYLFHGPHVSS
jgi:hypothetical protein